MRARGIPILAVLLGGPLWAAQIEGSWVLRSGPDPGTMRVELRRSDVIVGARQTIEVRPEELRGVSREQIEGEAAAAEFELVRDAGRLRFRGRIGKSGGEGTFRFVADPKFRQEMRVLLRDWWDDEKVFEMAMRGVDRAYVRSVAAPSAGPMRAFDVIRRHALETAPILDPSPENREALQKHGVTTEYLRSLKEAGYLFSAEEAIRLHSQGVSPDLLRQMKLAGYEAFSAADMLKLQTYGVTSFDIQQMEARGLKNLTPDEMVRWKTNGLPARSDQSDPPLQR